MSGSDETMWNRPGAAHHARVEDHGSRGEAAPPGQSFAEPRTEVFASGTVAHLPFSAVLLNDAREVVIANEPAWVLLGCEKGDLEGRDVGLFDQPVDAEPVRPRIDALIRGDESSTHVVKPWTRGDGSALELRLRAFRVSGGGRVRVLLLIEDISAEQFAARSERAELGRYRDMVETAAQGVLWTDAEGKVLYVNHRLASSLGHTADELTGLQLATLLVPGGERMLLVGSDHNIDCPFRHKDGHAVWMLASAQPFLAGTGEYLGTIAMLTDITDRRRVEQERARLAAIVESSTDAIFGESLDGRILSWNHGAEQHYGFSAEEIVGRPAAMLAPPDCVRDLEELGMRVRSGERVARCESVARRKDGTQFDVALTVSPVMDPAGHVVAVATIAQDISAQKRFQKQLAFAEKMASLGTLASGVAHEINNPLTYVKTNLDWTVKRLGLILDGLGSPGSLAASARELADILDALREAQLGANRVRGIVRELKTFSRSDDDQPTLVSIHRVLESAMNMASGEIRYRARLVKDFSDVPPILANEGKVAQVFLNLLVNAAHAIPVGDPKNGEIRVTTKRGSQGEVVVEVRDSGVGIAPEHIPRLFDPFFTTKPVGVGTGLGLSICHGIVSRMNGRIEVESELGAGSTFRLILPTGETLERSPSTPPPGVSRSRRSRILCVDDEMMVLASFRRLLSIDHDVVAIERSPEALARISRGEDFDVIISDLMMPELNGVELHAQVLAIRPEFATRFVFVSGGAMTNAMRDYIDRTGSPRIEKPFDAQVLNTLVESIVRTNDRADPPKG